MHLFAHCPFRTGLTLLAGALIAGATSMVASTEEGLFLAETKAAMAKMMGAMDVEPSGDVDADFVAMMVPHHQGAIDMARAQLRYGHNEQLRRMAQEIIVTQLQEIAAMRLAISQPLPPSVPPPDLPPSALSASTHPILHPSMHMHQEP